MHQNSASKNHIGPINGNVRPNFSLGHPPFDMIVPIILFFAPVISSAVRHNKIHIAAVIKYGLTRCLLPLSAISLIGFGLKKNPERIKNNGMWKLKIKFLTINGIPLQCPKIISKIPIALAMSLVASRFGKESWMVEEVEDIIDLNVTGVFGMLFQFCMRENNVSI